MLRISKLADYATLIMSYLALHSNQIFSAVAIAKQIHLAVPTVSKILKILAEAKLVISQRGAAGGYKIARSAEDITVAELVSAIEGYPSLTECCSSSACALDSLCAIKDNWKMINKVMMSALASLTLQDMLQPLVRHPLTLRGISIKVQHEQ